jgi:hypothetical protein
MTGDRNANFIQSKNRSFHVGGSTNDRYFMLSVSNLKQDFEVNDTRRRRLIVSFPFLLQSHTSWEMQVCRCNCHIKRFENTVLDELIAINCSVLSSSEDLKCTGSNGSQ